MGGTTLFLLLVESMQTDQHPMSFLTIAIFGANVWLVNLRTHDVKGGQSCLGILATAERCAAHV